MMQNKKAQTNSGMPDEDFKAFQKAWLDYPSQDNEGYRPDRGGFKCGWFASEAYWKEKYTKKYRNQVIDQYYKEYQHELSIIIARMDLLVNHLLKVENKKRGKKRVKKTDRTK